MAASAEGLIKSPPLPVSEHSLWKAVILCVSYANLCFVNVWTDLSNRHLGFFRKQPFSQQELMAVSFDILLFALLLWIPICLVTRFGNRRSKLILKGCALVGMIIPLNALRKSILATVPSLPKLTSLPLRILLVLACVTAGIFLIARKGHLAGKALSAILLLLSPIMPVVVARCSWDIYTNPPIEKPLAKFLPQAAGAPHLLWFIFDEWDEALSFTRRPANLELPELDRWRAGSFYASDAFSPNRDTIVSVPSLVAGKTFVDKELAGSDELLMTYDRKQPAQRLTAQPSIFSQALSMGFNVGIAGNYLPYCRLFSSTTCDWHCNVEFHPQEWEYPLSVGQLMTLFARRQVRTIPLALRFGLDLPVDAVSEESLVGATYRQIRDAALRSVVDPRLNLVFIHWDIPHPPGKFDANTGEFANGPSRTYLDNLKLVDLTVRDIRLALGRIGRWDDSTILITSDHPLRLDHWDSSALAPASAGRLTQGSTVPFILKLAGQNEGFTYAK
ncbi:MAG: sulfatase-like hydrolase/transferase, partial [Candidatus Solibacter sp.]